ncbi:serine hydrolase domain-containing protein [Qipengyuania sp.]|uniref:serine hydrolase domain-containing protein n=1 Tax=Qipengyuania sp. TaxID=2004515 RepID=UPI0035C80901
MKGILGMVAALALAGCSTAAMDAQLATRSTPSEWLPTDAGPLFWSQQLRTDRFRSMEKHFAGLETGSAAKVRALPKGSPFSTADIASFQPFLNTMNAAGMMVLQDGKVRYESYRLGFEPDQRWTSFSVAKSFTSTLLGAAVNDGSLTLSDPVTKYLPGLVGTAYDGVTVEQVATMTSGVAWNEDYTDPQSDVAQMLALEPAQGELQSVAYAKTLKREAPAGEKWVYKTLETNLLGDIVSAAVGKDLASCAKSRIVNPAGFAGSIFWMTDLSNQPIAGCCVSLRLSDYARMGQWVMEGGQPSVPEGWFARAGAPQVDLGCGYGYGYQWWTFPGGEFGAQGIFGQYITIMPQERVVVAVVSSNDTATGDALTKARRGLWNAVRAAAKRTIQ